MATKRVRSSGTWEFTIRRAKLLPKPISLTFECEAEGDRYCARLEQLLDAGVVPEELLGQSEDAIVDVEGAIRAYLKRVSISESDKRILNALISRLPNRSLPMLNYAWVENWVTSMKRVDNLAPCTIRHHVGAMARCLDWVVRTGSPMLPTNPIRLLPKRYATYTAQDHAVLLANQVGTVKVDASRDRRLHGDEEMEIRRIMMGGRPEDRERSFDMRYRPALIFLFELALESGMRLREMYSLQRPQFDTAKRTVFLDKTKNGSKRPVPLTSVAIKAYDDYVEAIEQGDPEMQGFSFDEGYLFPWLPGMYPPGSEMRKEEGRTKLLEKVTSRLSGQFGRIFEAAGCSDLTFHDLRHEATSRLFEKTTLSDIQIAKITGHSSTKMLMRYANLRGSDLAARLW
jgi:integrase